MYEFLSDGNVCTSRQNQTVGWPPVKNFNKNNTPAPPPSAPATACRSVPMPRRGASSSSSGNLVKIYMDGVPFGRKVDLKTNNSYEKLYYTLEDMFQHYINGMHYTSLSLCWYDFTFMAG